MSAPCAGESLCLVVVRCSTRLRDMNPIVRFGDYVKRLRTRIIVRYLVDPASSHMLVPKITPCMSKYKSVYGETANGSLYQL